MNTIQDNDHIYKFLLEEPELEICNSYEEYTEWVLSEQLSGSSAPRLSDICQKKSISTRR